MQPLRHDGLRDLRIETIGLPSGAEDLQPILTGTRLPALTSLSICNAADIDRIVAALAAWSLAQRLQTLDLSFGTLSDAGAAMLLNGRFTALRRLNVVHHFLTDAMQNRLVTGLGGNGTRVELDDPQQSIEDADDFDDLDDPDNERRHIAFNRG